VSAHGRLAPICGVRLSGAAGARGGLGLVGWFGPKWFLFFFPGFSNSFSISFSIGFFNSNSNQVSNSNQFKLVQHFKEYFNLSMMQHVMTHKVLTKINN
jgi:hypothetical protein